MDQFHQFYHQFYGEPDQKQTFIRTLELEQLINVMNFTKALKIIYSQVSLLRLDVASEQIFRLQVEKISGGETHSNSIGNVYQVVRQDSIVRINELKFANQVLRSMAVVPFVLQGLFVNPDSILVHVHSVSIYQLPPNVTENLSGARRNSSPGQFNRLDPLDF